MNLLFIAGSLLLGWNVAAQMANIDTSECTEGNAQVSSGTPETRAVLDQIVFIEEEKEVALGFDTAAYLPKHFDPYVGDMEAIAFLDLFGAPEVDLEFEVIGYLPQGFDPYLGNLYDLAYEEDLGEEPVILSFDTADYLPKGFDAYLGNYNDLAYIEDQEEIELGFDTSAYLPPHFDPHVGDLDKILFLELDHIFPSGHLCDCDHTKVVF